MSDENTVVVGNLRTLGQFQPRFCDESEPSGFFSLVEWYAAVMFPNFQETMILAKGIRQAARAVERRSGSENLSTTEPFVRRGLELASKTDELHAEMAKLDDWVIEAERLSHRLSDELETINHDMHFTLKCLRNVVERWELGLDEGSMRPSDNR